MISIRDALLAKCFLPWTEQPFKIEDVDDASAYVATDRIPEEPNGKINSHTTTLESDKKNCTLSSSGIAYTYTIHVIIGSTEPVVLSTILHKIFSVF